jgi:hypothetical protein
MGRERGRRTIENEPDSKHIDSIACVSTWVRISVVLK